MPARARAKFPALNIQDRTSSASAQVPEGTPSMSGQTQLPTQPGVTLLPSWNDAELEQAVFEAVFEPLNRCNHLTLEMVNGLMCKLLPRTVVGRFARLTSGG